MDLNEWLNLHADDVLLAAGVLVSVVAAALAAIHGCELTLRGAHRVGLWRLQLLHQARQAMAIRLEMERSIRHHRDQAERPEQERLQRAAAAAALQIQELRQLLHAQQEVLAVRAGRIAACEQAALASAAQSADDQASAAQRGEERAAIIQERDQLADELAQRDQVISMLSSQLATRSHAAELAQAGLADARVQGDLLQEKLQAALARCTLLAEIREVRSWRGLDPDAVPAGTLIAGGA